MAIAGEQTTGVITIEIGQAQVLANKFEQGIRSFLTMLKDVSRHVCEGHIKGIEWSIGLREGSMIVDFIPRAVAAAPAKVEIVRDTVEIGIDSVEGGVLPPAHFSDKAIAHAAKFAGALGAVAKIRVDGRVHLLSANAIANADAWAGVASRDWGTVEGQLWELKESGGLKFMVNDILTNRSTECIFDEQLLDDIKDSFRHRVSVTGLIRYKANGEPVSIDVEDFCRFPEEDTLPTIDEMRGILRKS